MYTYKYIYIYIYIQSRYHFFVKTMIAEKNFENLTDGKFTV